MRGGKKKGGGVGEFNIEVQSVRTGLYLASGGSSDRQDYSAGRAHPLRQSCRQSLHGGHGALCLTDMALTVQGHPLFEEAQGADSVEQHLQCGRVFLPRLLSL